MLIDSLLSLGNGTLPLLGIPYVFLDCICFPPSRSFHCLEFCVSYSLAFLYSFTTYYMSLKYKFLVLPGFELYTVES